MNKTVDSMGKIVEADRLGKPRRDPGREFQLIGLHSRRCKREKHEDWQHGTHGCAVGKSERDHCDCTAIWREKRPTGVTKSGGLGQ